MTEPEYCECCGVYLDELRKEIKENGKESFSVLNKQKIWCDGKHTLYEDGYVDPKSSYVDYCGGCGVKLQYGDYKLIYESHPWGSTTATETLIDGYKCHACGFETEV